MYKSVILYFKYPWKNNKKFSVYWYVASVHDCYYLYVSGNIILHFTLSNLLLGYRHFRGYDVFKYSTCSYYIVIIFRLTSKYISNLSRICCLVYRLTNLKYHNVTCTIYFKGEFSSYLIVVLKRGAKTTRQCVDNLQLSDTLYAVDFKISSCNKKSYDNTCEKKMLCFLFIWCL